MNITYQGRRGQQSHSALLFNNQRGVKGYCFGGQFRGRLFLRGGGMLTSHQRISQLNNRGGEYFNHVTV